MTLNHKHQLAELFSEYARLHNSLTDVLNQAKQLEATRAALSQQLDDIRNSEKRLINKIEEDLGRKLTQDDLIESLHLNEN